MYITSNRSLNDDIKFFCFTSLFELSAILFTFFSTRSENVDPDFNTPGPHQTTTCIYCILGKLSAIANKKELYLERFIFLDYSTISAYICMI